MTKNLREAAQQALEALKDYKCSDDDRVSIAMHILSTALEQAEPVQEPVGWRIRAVGSMGWRGPWRAYWQSARPGVNEPEFCEFEPLYTAPPQRKPLTDEEEK